MIRYAPQLLWMMLALVSLDLPLYAQSSKKSATAPKPAASAENTPETRAGREIVLGRLASEDAVFFLGSNGWKKPEAGSKNKTEKLWAEKSVQLFVQQFGDEIKKSIARQSEGGEVSAMLASTIPVLIDACIRHPMAISVTNLISNNDPEVNSASATGWFVVDAESDAALVRAAFEKLLESIPKETSGSFTKVTIEGATFYEPVLSPENQSDLPVLPRLGMYESYLIFTLGPDTTAETMKKITGAKKSPGWLENSILESKVDRASFVSILNVGAILKHVDSQVEDPMVRSVLDASGIMTIKRVTSVSGYDATGVVEKFTIKTDGTPAGLLALLPETPLSATDLKGVPADVAQATVIRFDLASLIKKILTICDQVSPEPRQQFDMAIEQLNQIAGFPVQADLIDVLGDVWTMYVSRTGTAGGLVPGVVVTLTVRDAKKLAQVQETLVRRANALQEQLGPEARFTLQEFTIGKAKGYQVQINATAMVTPTWVIADGRLVIGITPELVEADLATRGESETLASRDEVKAAFQRNPGPTMVSFRDPKPEFEGIYTMINSFSPMVLEQMRNGGFEFNIPPLPPFSSIEKHLAPSVTMISRDSSGWTSESRGVVSSLSVASPATVPVMIALLLPAVQQAREAARRTQAKNNLKQIGLSMHVYSDDHRSFPKRAISDADGSPQLSWRVAILPYLDQKELYDEFHLDEAWDSEHNKALIGRMPAVFATPGDDTMTKSGKTRYVVLAGDDTFFDGDDGPTIDDIEDGLSNTIMVVEARADHAVTWTAPDDLELDFEEPLAGLESSRTGGFQVLMGDGAIRFVSNLIDPETLLVLFSKSGGEPVGEF